MPWPRSRSFRPSRLARLFAGKGQETLKIEQNAKVFLEVSIINRVKFWPKGAGPRTFARRLGVERLQSPDPRRHWPPAGRLHRKIREIKSPRIGYPAQEQQPDSRAFRSSHGSESLSRDCLRKCQKARQRHSSLSMVSTRKAKTLSVSESGFAQTLPETPPPRGFEGGPTSSFCPNE